MQYLLAVALISVLLGISLFFGGLMAGDHWAIWLGAVLLFGPIVIGLLGGAAGDTGTK